MEDNTQLSSNELLAFQAISAFVNEASKVGGKIQRSLQLYNRLLEKTNISHVDSIRKHIKAFKDFCNNNQETLKTQNIETLNLNVIEYSSRVFINIRLLIINTDKFNAEIIWQHLITIGAIICPKNNFKKILEEKKTSNQLIDSGLGESSEDDFITSIMDKVENSINPDTSNPTDALGQIMSGGLMTDLMSNMTSGMQDGSLDLGKLMGSLQKMVTNLQDSDDVPPEIKNITGNLNQIIDTTMKNVNKTNSEQQATNSEQ